MARPDLMLTLDKDGVIQDVVPAEALAQERLSSWRGRRWRETIEPSVDTQILERIEVSRLLGDSACFQLRQRFPSGREFSMEYTTVSLGERAGFIAIGRNLETISELQSRLELAQQARERDYWKMREIETRYRMLFDASSEAVALVSVSDLLVVEANLAAEKELHLFPGARFLPDIGESERKAFDAMLAKTRELGRAPGIALRPSRTDGLWSVRASMMNAESGSLYLFQLAPMRDAPAPESGDGPSIDALVKRLPEGFAVVDRNLIVRWTNGAFLDLVQAGSESAVLGRTIEHWLNSPGADAAIIRNLAKKHGVVRRLGTKIESEFGETAEIEVSAAVDAPERPNYYGLLLKEAARPHADNAPETAVCGEEFDNRTLEQIVRASTETIERAAIARALGRFQGNRTAAARHLGLSRQSLHTKLRRYKLEEK